MIGRFSRLFPRSLALTLLALMLLVRIDPLCDAAAATAPVFAPEMAMGECHGAPPAPSSSKHASVASCATGCFALTVEMPTGCPSVTGEPGDVVVAPARMMAGLSGGPAPPPPRS